MTTVLDPRRVGLVTGSRIGTILGAPFTYQTEDDVLRSMVREHYGADPDPVSEFQQMIYDYGHQHEAEAVAEYAFTTGQHVHSPQMFAQDATGLPFAVTVDALVGDDGIVEVKAPWSSPWRNANDRPGIIAQARLQCVVTGRDWCDVAVWRPDEALTITRVTVPPGWVASIMPVVDAFLTRYTAALQDPAVWLEPLPVTDVRTDRAWEELAYGLREIRAQQKVLEAEATRLQDALVAAAGGQPSKGLGVSVYLQKPANAVRYKDALAKYAPEAPLDEFTTRGTEPVWRVRVS